MVWRLLGALVRDIRLRDLLAWYPGTITTSGATLVAVQRLEPLFCRLFGVFCARLISRLLVDARASDPLVVWSGGAQRGHGRRPKRRISTFPAF